MIRSLHVIAGIHPRNGGPSYSVPRLCEALRLEGGDPEILTIEEGPMNRPEMASFFPQAWANFPTLGRLKLSSDLRRAIREQIGADAVIHSHGLWLAPNIYAGLAARSAGQPLVVSPRGMVSKEALQFSRRSKILMWNVLQGPAYRQAHAWHATSSDEADDIRAFGIDAPVVVIPNGIDLPVLVAPHPDHARQRTVLFLSRIHPKKGLPTLIEAWGRLAPGRDQWRLVIAGPDEGGHRRELEAQTKKLGLATIEFREPLYGADKDKLLRQSDLFVLPTINENFGIAVAEALAAGVPAIVTKGAPWGGLIDNDCGWWIDHGAEPLMIALAEAMAAEPARRKAMGKRGRDWMERDFGWAAIARQMGGVYKWLKGAGDMPDCARAGAGG